MRPSMWRSQLLCPLKARWCSGQENPSHVVKLHNQHYTLHTLRRRIEDMDKGTLQQERGGMRQRTMDLGRGECSCFHHLQTFTTHSST